MDRSKFKELEGTPIHQTGMRWKHFGCKFEMVPYFEEHHPTAIKNERHHAIWKSMNGGRR